MGAGIGMMRVKQVVVMGADMKICGKKRKEGQRQNTEALKVTNGTIVPLTSTAEKSIHQEPSFFSAKVGYY